MKTKSNYQRVEYTFNGGGVCQYVLDGRQVTCFDGAGQVAWTRSFHTRQDAENLFNDDLRIMRNHSSYKFPVAV